MNKIMVSPLILCEAPWRGGRACRLLCLPGKEDLLHEFAQRIGVWLQWFRNEEEFPYYDLSPSFQQKAIAHGAVEIEWAELNDFFQLWDKQGTSSRGVDKIEDTQDPICPYCGHPSSNWREEGLPLESDKGDEWWDSCLICERDFMVITKVSYTFTSYR